LNNDNPFGLTFDTIGSVNIQLPAGPSYDDHYIDLFVQVFDDTLAITVFKIPTRVMVKIDAALTSSLANEILTSNTVLESIQKSDLKSSVNTMLTITSMVNENQDSINNEVR
jgi:hypothetical protein